ncbi:MULTISPECIES: ABC transporter substrate-binding protein [Cobetia]|uniref:ABC transporter substrate-binding protein n=1 Tax=Cobetia TaxID=204286 RepID=UPI002097BC99|nr:MULTISPECIES: ABC transporter substrate-binding protein [unclassified Cobetia]MCO7231805.1 ABC transporter substrate-binding protein [Cobetia sp. Dlab-2-AX]MCO7234879.1 ABC transporter substrate-binding protein [Cobetia sp. Dlab-2-U]MDL2190310.1 ABC transporter substrate-binding protein [Cobetia sp. LC6]
MSHSSSAPRRKAQPTRSPRASLLSTAFATLLTTLCLSSLPATAMSAHAAEAEPAATSTQSAPEIVAQQAEVGVNGDSTASAPVASQEAVEATAGAAEQAKNGAEPTAEATPAGDEQSADADSKDVAKDAATAEQPLTQFKVMLDWYTNPGHAPLVLAQELGLFKKHDLDVELIAPADPSVPPKLAAAERVDIAISYQPQLHLQIDQGLPLVRIGTLVATPLNVVVVRADSDIQSIADLKGKRVGYSVGGVEEVLLSTMLQHSGLTLDDITLTNVNFSLTPSLLTRKVDAVTGAFRNFELAQMAQEGVKGRAFYIEEEGVPTYDELIFVANSDSYERKQAQYAGFLAAVGEATAWIINHPDQGWEMFRDSDPALDTELNKEAWYATLPRFALRPAALDAGRYRDFEDFLFERGMIKKRQSLSHLAVDVNAP